MFVFAWRIFLFYNEKLCLTCTYHSINSTSFGNGCRGECHLVAKLIWFKMSVLKLRVLCSAFEQIFLQIFKVNGDQLFNLKYTYLRSILLAARIIKKLPAIACDNKFRVLCWSNLETIKRTVM